MDLVIRGARVADGTGGPSYLADVGVHEGRIAAVGRLPGGGRRTVDAYGLVLAPGSSTCTPTATSRCSATRTTRRRPPRG